MYCSTAGATCNRCTARYAPRGAVLYLYPDDISVFHAQARANGLDVPELETTFYGMREFAIHDPDGHLITFAERVAE